MLDKLKIENVTMAKVTSTTRDEKNLVEPIPMREAIINAIVHTDYSREIPPVFELFSDRMEFTSYGGLIPGQSEEDFFSCGSMPRNRELMRVFKDVGLVEQLGSGMSRILQAYSKSIFHISEHFIKAVFPFSQSQKVIAAIGDNTGDINGDNRTIEDRVLECLMHTPSMTAKAMSHLLHTSERTISRAVRNLRETGRIVRKGSTRKGEWQIVKEK